MTQVTNMAARIGILEGRVAEEERRRIAAERSLKECGEKLRAAHRRISELEER